MKRRTLICLFKDDSNKEFCIRNRNTDYFGTQFQKYLDAIPQEGDYSLVQETIIINKFFANSSFEVISIIEAENRYNRDQSSIRKFKDEYSRRMTIDGYTWNEELDKFFKERYNDNEENNKLRDTLMNFRNLQTLYEEKGSLINKEIARLTKKVDALKEQEKKYTLEIEELEDKKETIGKDVEALRSRFKKGKSCIEEQQKTIDELDSKYAIKFEEISTEYDNKIKEYDSNFQKHVDERMNEISEDIKDREERLSYLEKRLSSLDSELEFKLSEFNASLNSKRESFNQDTKALQEQKDNIKNQIQLLTEERDSIEEIIKRRIAGILTEADLLSRLDSTVKMIKMNKNYYNNLIPQYEIDFLIKNGLKKEVVIEAIKKNNLGIKQYE